MLDDLRWMWSSFLEMEARETRESLKPESELGGTRREA